MSEQGKKEKGADPKAYFKANPYEKEKAAAKTQRKEQKAEGTLVSQLRALRGSRPRRGSK